MQVEMEDTYLLYLPATQSEHVAAPELVEAMIIHTESRYTHTYNRVSRHIRERWIQSYTFIRHSTSGLGACSTITQSTYSHTNVFNSKMHGH